MQAPKLPPLNIWGAPGIAKGLYRMQRKQDGPAGL